MNTGNKQKRILLVLSSVDELGVSGKQTGHGFMNWLHLITFSPMRAMKLCLPLPRVEMPPLIC